MQCTDLLHQRRSTRVGDRLPGLRQTGSTRRLLFPERLGVTGVAGAQVGFQSQTLLQEVPEHTGSDLGVRHQILGDFMDMALHRLVGMVRKAPLEYQQ